MVSVNKNIKGKTIIHPDARLLDACIALRQYVEHLGKRANDLDMKNKVHTVSVDGVEIGYKVQSSALLINPYFVRHCYIKTPGWRLDELKSRELAAIKTAVLEAFFEPQQGDISIKIPAYDCMVLSQMFSIAMIKRGNERFSNRDMLDKGLIING